MKSCVNDRGVASNGGLLDSLIRRNELWEQGQQTFGEGCEGRGRDFSRHGSDWYSRPLIPRRSARANFLAFLFWQTVFSPMGFSAHSFPSYISPLYTLLLISAAPCSPYHPILILIDTEYGLTSRCTNGTKTLPLPRCHSLSSATLTKMERMWPRSPRRLDSDPLHHWRR